MEKMKPFLDFLKRNWFWLSSGAMAILLIVAWFLASGALTQAQEQDTQALNGKIAELENVLKTSAEGLDPEVKAHPNELSKEGMEQRLAEGQQAVLEAWKLRREAQEPIMVWPEEVLKSPEFVKFFARFSPPEAYEKIPQEQVATYLQMYTREIPKRMPEICKIIGSKWDAEEAEKALEKGTAGRDESREDGGREGSAGRGGQGAPTASSSTDLAKSNSVVLWNADNQKLWLDKLTKFQGFDGNNQVFATAYQAFALQQDLWLLEAMFKVIKEVNGDADANDLAAIREIDHIAFGREARASLGTLSEIDSRLADASVTDAALGAGGASGAKMPSEDEIRKNDPFSAPAAAGGEGGAVFEKEPPAGFEALGPFHGRYVNANLEPISVKDVHDVLKLSGTGLPEQNLELLVAKRVPVRIALKMDENKIPAFIAACANSPFGFEINQVRINRHKAGEGIELNGGAKAKSDSGGGGRDGRDQPTVGVGGGSAGGSGLDGGGSEEDTTSAGGVGSNAPMVAERRTNMIVDVEFAGIVKIYNPVNEKRLSPGGETEDGNATASAAATGGGAGRP